MAEWSNAIMTDVGAALQAKVNAGRTKLTFTKIKVGSGTNATNPLALTNVISSKWETTNFVVKQEGKIVSVNTFITNNGITEAFRMSEIGLFAQDPDKGEVLYAYLTDPEPDRMPAGGGSVVVSQELTIGMVFSNTGNVSLTVNMGALVTRAQLEKHNTDEHAHDIRFAKYLPLAGGTVTGNIKVNNAAVGFNNGNGTYDAKIRVASNGNFDIGVTEDAANKNATTQLLLHSQYRPRWYNSTDGSKQLAIVDDIDAAKNSLTAAMNNYLPLAGGTVTGAINFTSGSLKGQIALKPNGNLDLGSLETKCSVLNSRDRPLWYTGDSRGGMLALTRDIVPDPTQCANLYDAKSEGYYDGRPQGTVNLKSPYTDYDYLIIVLSAYSGEFMGVSQINVSWLEKVRKMSVGTGLEVINIATVGNFYWGINNKSTPTKMITNSGYENSHLWEVWGYKITR